jgi:tetratricopeptide (TPR) repeat protein
MNTGKERDESLFEQETDFALDKDEIEEITTLSKRGYQLLKEDHVDGAEEYFKTILEKYPENNYALVGLGDVERKRKNFRKALPFYQTCLNYFPNNNYAHFGAADCYKSLKKLPEAIESWGKYLENDKGNVTVLARIADAHRKLKNFPESKPAYLKVLDIDPNNSYALIGLGYLHFDFQEFEQALHYWESMYELNPEGVDIRVLTTIGNCHRKLKTFEKGLTYFKKALDLDSRNFFALFGTADCYRGLMDYENSLIYWLKILNNDPKNKIILTRAGDAYRVLHLYEKAEEFYKKALAIDYDTYAILGLALLSKERGNYGDAISKIENLTDNDMKNHRYYIELSKCYQEMGDMENAVKVLQKFQNLGIYNIYIATMIDKLEENYLT